MLRDLAEGAVGHGDLLKAWTWQHLALLHGMDLTVSVMRAHHDGGLQHGEFYDSGFGGAMYANGDEGLRLLPLGLDEFNGPGRWHARSTQGLDRR